MLKIPTYHGPTGSHVTTEDDPDTGLVFLAVEIDRGEVIGSPSSPPPEIRAEIDRLVEGYHDDLVLIPGSPSAHALALAGEVRRLRTALASTPSTIERALGPDEARELAAALWHHAGQADGGNR